MVCFNLLISILAFLPKCDGNVEFIRLHRKGFQYYQGSTFVTNYVINLFGCSVNLILYAFLKPLQPLSFYYISWDIFYRKATDKFYSEYLFSSHERGHYHIEISASICRANQWTGFYMIETSVMKDLKYSHLFPISGKTNSVAGRKWFLLIYSFNSWKPVTGRNFWAKIFHTTNYKGNFWTGMWNKIKFKLNLNRHAKIKEEFVKPFFKTLRRSNLGFILIVQEKVRKQTRNRLIKAPKFIR